MQPSYKNNHPLKKLFAGLVEQAFCVEVGLCEPALNDYVVEMMLEFTHSDRLYKLRDASGRRIDSVVGMLETLSTDREASCGFYDRDVYRHIGDFALFWSGVFPEGLRRGRGLNPDRLIDYVDRGKQSYARASELSDEDSDPPRSLFRRLSKDFEVCAHGLGLVRRGWEHRDHDMFDGDRSLLY